MNQLISSYLTALRQVQWQSPDEFVFPSELARRWLSEQGSLSRLLETYCQQLSVELLHNRVVKAQRLDSQEIDLLADEDCLLRKVILNGDQTPWVLGRTLIPQSSLLNQQHDLSRQGEIPLGLTVFSTGSAQRDALQMGWARTAHGEFLARRSRLWMNHKPMLVAELFLPTCPIYSKESI
ncbi:chorismate lyase [Vibrio sp. V39_P1S14PM300]|uniref:chorismate lyase n=1 Tax=Vibrio sp. V39_P1S14PM300 TaxID=1938690 RepID=UPI0013724D1A|nr:chorismate lyase [Vibrio sp. V39_P1S14PM300]NAX22905.1 chorismate lyase [Vibrio sp. V39_P1S14PM300]